MEKKAPPWIGRRPAASSPHPQSTSPAPFQNNTIFINYLNRTLSIPLPKIRHNNCSITSIHNSQDTSDANNMSPLPIHAFPSLRHLSPHDIDNTLGTTRDTQSAPPWSSTHPLYQTYRFLRTILHKHNKQYFASSIQQPHQPKTNTYPNYFDLPIQHRSIPSPTMTTTSNPSPTGNGNTPATPPPPQRYRYQLLCHPRRRR